MTKNKKFFINIILIICTFCYLWILLKVIIFKNGFTNNGHIYNLHLFDFIRQLDEDGITQTFLINVLGNIALFIPLSIIIMNYYNYLNNLNVIFINFVTSFSFELIQLSTGWGIFDLDDILLNTIGGILGLLIYRFFKSKYNSKLSSAIFLINFGIAGYISLSMYNPTILQLKLI